MLMMVIQPFDLGRALTALILNPWTLAFRIIAASSRVR